MNYLLGAILFCHVAAQEQSNVVNGLDEILGDEYMRLSPQMCFAYDGHIGGYLQTTDLYPTNSKFETIVDISNVDIGAVAQFTIHRNSYQTLSGIEKFAISLIYDRDQSDYQIGQNVGVLDSRNDAVMFLEIIG